MYDFKIDIKSSNSDKNKLEHLRYYFKLGNLVQSETCFMKNNKSFIDLILTNKPLHFQKTHVADARLSYYRKMVSMSFKVRSSKTEANI